MGRVDPGGVKFPVHSSLTLYHLLSICPIQTTCDMTGKNVDWDIRTHSTTEQNMLSAHS